MVLWSLSLVVVTVLSDDNWNNISGNYRIVIFPSWANLVIVYILYNVS